ncbi:MAG: polymerase beta domain protein region protein [Candidatus Gottesmanbacteria bacterium GW2011_GWB1_43_11]|uniref:Polymerase beta domain protein region protein n=1 Tax=Candidatus Gottesmanbacteria bacterium GW2011_GWB1_43_11 TaxID=1618446 RepID=A0A0G1EUH8_9BACT|nr:MAG: polymerase beta domain protein region protein [Candidatus Gottesmanbacteria bacterium GW2011_GWA2_42_16]KKS54976.1 MAG: polymerase beta domain protein region protein [Candidatus Gottesmanbacteria bacterium GW2011_GWA1_42_26]KKS81443.1 MAG: polymerase beta domain protein region protein [Candidatus Gottesmanbacteria bacterium GW2011_GWC1_43_10]KKS86681.1 MAG: polymerase beta domain protein region protein [Candidatus Gottesmanbacteria bacterium GW2011_GWB1_43_11]HCM37427.1 hypothetical pro
MKNVLSSDQMQKIARFFKKRSDITAVYLFGSLATNTASALSDIDLAILYKTDPADITETRIDLITTISKILGTDNVDIQVLHSAMSLPLAEQILKYGRILVDSDPDKRISFENKMRGLVFDFEPYLIQYLDAMEERLKKGTYGHR